MTSAQDRNPIRFAGRSGLSSGARRLKEQLERARKLRNAHVAEPLRSIINAVSPEVEL